MALKPETQAALDQAAASRDAAKAADAAAAKADTDKIAADEKAHTDITAAMHAIAAEFDFPLP